MPKKPVFVENVTLLPGTDNIFKDSKTMTYVPKFPLNYNYNTNNSLEY
jgi:hypothetical protein